MSIQSEINRISTAVSDQEALIGEIVDALAARCVVTEPILQSKTITPSKAQQTVTPDSGYNGLSSVVVEAAPSAILQSKTVTPTEEVQTVTPDAGYDGLSSVTVEAAQGGEGTYGWKKCVSRLPSGYTEVEYIQSNGTQRINTGFVPTDKTVIEAKMGAANNHFYTAISNTSNGRFGIYVNLGKTIDIAFGQSGYVGSIVSGVEYPAEITFKNGSVTVNGVTKTFTTQNAFTGAGYLTIFGAGTTPCPGGEVYYFKIYNNGTLVRDFVPCINASGAAGLYDLVNGAFYSNAGSGTFTVGASSGGSVVGYVVSDDANAYPDGAFLDGYYYEKL